MLEWEEELTDNSNSADSKCSTLTDLKGSSKIAVSFSMCSDSVDSDTLYQMRDDAQSENRQNERD